MAADPMDWLPGSFFHTPDWRLLRAEYLLATGRRLDPRVDDDWVAHARAALRGRGTGDPAVAAVRAARGVWAGGPDVRGELEALLLTEEPLDRVAGRVRLPPAVAAANAQVFFAVRPLRRAADWVLARAVGYGPLRGFTGPLPWAAWKLAAFHGGPLLLDVVMDATAGGWTPADVMPAAAAATDPTLRTRALACI